MPVMRWAVDASLSTGAMGCIKYNSPQCTRHRIFALPHSIVRNARQRTCLSWLLLLWWWRWLLWLWLNTLLSLQPPPWTTSLPHLKRANVYMPKPRESKWFIILLTKSCFLLLFFPLYTNCLVSDWKFKAPHLSGDVPLFARCNNKNFFFSSMECVVSTCVQCAWPHILHTLWFNN